MEAIQLVVFAILLIASVVGVIKLGQHWGFTESLRKDAEAWGYLKWGSEDLTQLHEKLVALIASGKRKPAYFRSLEAIKQALEMRKRLASQQSHKSATSAPLPAVERRPPEQIMPSGFPNLVESFATEAQACANEMIENSAYIKKELPHVTITEELRNETTSICQALTATGNVVISELAGWINQSFSQHELTRRASDIVRQLSANLTNLHDLVMALRAKSDTESKFGSASLLVGESATNILLAFNRTADAATQMGNAGKRA